jgi:hypothetical protein
MGLRKLSIEKVPSGWAYFVSVERFLMTNVDLSKRLNMALPTVIQAVIRGQKIAEDQGLSLIDKINQ